MPVSEAIGKSIVTIEGLAPAPDRLHPVQQAFIDGAASQCGYCTGGMILATVALLQHTPSPTDAQIVEWMNPHLCRCCNYTRIQDCIKKAATATAAEV
jgi:aerobic-type carbon monoxide dehydrogenase small subunit (CoxS/CutS family)